jgi:GAF domain-containing protein
MLIGVVILLQDHVPKAGFLWLVFSLRSQILIYNKRKGTANDIYQAGLKDCHVTLLEQFQAKAFATAPILQGDKLWGVIAAYQNASSRQWQSYEVDSLSKIGTQIGVVSC